MITRNQKNVKSENPLTGKIDYKDNTGEEIDYSNMNVVSMTECTGLVQQDYPITGDEEDSYTEIYDIPRPTDKDTRTKGTSKEPEHMNDFENNNK